MSIHFCTPRAAASALPAGELLVAGDGVYTLVHCFGVTVPLLVASCELRGLVPLAGMRPDDPARHRPLEDGGGAVPPPPFLPSYHLMTREQRALPPVDPARIYQYVVAGNGVYLLAKCASVEVLMPISAPSSIPGLRPVAPYVRFLLPRVDAATVSDLLERSRVSRGASGELIEKLFYLCCEGGAWVVHEPRQEQAAGWVRALDAADGPFERAALEGHSHHRMPAYFSHTDNQAEVAGGLMRVYFVLGRIDTRPEVRARICVHGYAWEVPAQYFFALPAGVRDVVAQEWVARS